MSGRPSEDSVKPLLDFLQRLEESDLPPLDRHVAIVVARLADNATQTQWYGAETIAMRTGWKPRAVKAALKRLTDAGILKEVGWGPRGTKKRRYVTEAVPRSETFQAWLSEMRRRKDRGGAAVAHDSTPLESDDPAAEDTADDAGDSHVSTLAGDDEAVQDYPNGQRVQQMHGGVHQLHSGVHHVHGGGAPDAHDSAGMSSYGSAGIPLRSRASEPSSEAPAQQVVSLPQPQVARDRIPVEPQPAQAARPQQASGEGMGPEPVAVDARVDLLAGPDGHPEDRAALTRALRSRTPEQLQRMMEEASTIHAKDGLPPPTWRKLLRERKRVR